MRRIRRILPLLAVWSLVNAPVWASPQGDAVLGADGEVYTAKEGTYGQLFPGGKAVDPSYPVLAIEVAKANGTQERILVEGTEGPDQDRLPFLLYEESSRSVFILWETRFNSIHSILMLSGYNGSWIDPVEINSNPLVPKTSPQIAVTRDTLREPGSDGSLTTRHRTVLHLVWGEELASGWIEPFYAPVILDEGVLAARGTVFRLADFDTSSVESPASPDLGQTLAIIRGRDERTATVAFPSPYTRRLVTLEIDALPAQLGRLSDEARMHIIDLGARYSYPAGYRKVADLARMHIIDLGARGFQTEVVQAMAQKVNDLILQNQGKDQIKVIADLARMHIIDLGAKLSNRGLRHSTSSSVSQIKEIPGPQDGPTAPLQLLNFRFVASWPAPEIGNGPARYFPARSGKALLVAWQDTGKIKYRESQEGAWSPTKEIALSPAMSLDRVYQILEERMNQN